MNFTKMQATGNDFVVIEASRTEHDWPSLARSMCDRHFGIGADGLLLILPSTVADLRLRMFNPDGSEAEACGNGTRCLGKYALERALAAVNDGEIRVETVAGIRKVRLCATSGQIQVQMGTPQFRPDQIPLAIGPDKVDLIPLKDYPLIIAGQELRLSFVSMGNPHAVCFIEEDVADFPLTELGPLVEHHSLFPQRVNFEVANVLSTAQVKARVWERGAGETLSCGSGACAIAVAAHLHGHVGKQVDIVVLGGVVSVEWDGKGEVLLSGPARVVFEGEWAI